MFVLTAVTLLKSRGSLLCFTMCEEGEGEKYIAAYEAVDRFN